MAIEYVKFQRGSLAAYEALKAAGRLDANTLYFIKVEGGVGRLYMGENLISGGDIVLQSAKLDDLEDVIISNAKAGSFLVYENEKWIAKSLEEVAELIVGDFEPFKFNEGQFSVGEDGLVGLAGFEAAEVGAQLVKKENGSIEWVKPEEISLEGLATSEELEAAVENLQEAINAKASQEDINKAISDLDEQIGGNIDEVVEGLEEQIAAKADASVIEEALKEKANIEDVYSKTETDSAIAVAVANVAHLKREIFNDYDAAEARVKELGNAAGEYIYMVARGENSNNGNHYDEYMAFKLSEDSDVWLLEKVGDWGVDLTDYAKTDYVNAELEKKVDTKDGHRLINPEEIEKLSALVIGEDNKIEISGIVNADNVQGLDTWLATNGANYIEGLDESNLADELVEKINYITSVDGDSFEVENGKLQLLSSVKSDLNSLSNIISANDDSAKYLTTEAEKNALTAVIAGDFSNYISSVDENSFAVNGGKLELVNVSAGALTAVVGDLTSIVNYVEGTTIVDEINNIYSLLTWNEM